MKEIIKTCPKCGKEHTNRRAQFCSRTCANSRVHTEEDKKKRKKKLLEYHQTPEGAATREKSARFVTALNKGEEHTEVNVEEWAVDIPTIRDIRDYDDFLQNYQRGENW